MKFRHFFILCVLAATSVHASDLKSNFLQIKFASPEEGGSLVSLKNESGTEFVNYPANGPLWSIRMKKNIPADFQELQWVQLSIDPERDDQGGGGNTNDSGDDFAISALDVRKAGGKVEVVQKEDSIVYHWKNLNVKEESGVLDVWTEIKFSPDRKRIVFNGGFTNRSKVYTVFYFQYPCLDGIGKISGKPEEDFLATPFFNGRLIRNPVERGLLGSRRIFQPNRSGHSMQMDAVYNNGQGLYLAVEDPAQYVKRYEITSQKKSGITWSLFNVPNNMRQIPQEWKNPYPVCLQMFRGDWYDACRIYRTWALQQDWCQNGKLVDRKDIPVWFKELNEWFQGHPVQAKRDNAKFIQDFRKYQLGAWIFYWGRSKDKGHRMMSLDRFPVNPVDENMIRYFHEQNVKVMGYIQCTSWADDSQSFRKNPDASQNLVRNYYGKSLRWKYIPALNSSQAVAYPGALWTKSLGDRIVEMAKFGFDAAYLDSANHGGTYLNFTPACSKDSGGGTGYIHNNRNLLKTVRARAREVRPDFCTTAESFWEGNLGCLDAYLVCNTTNAYLEDDRVTAIPMIHSVYHDYTLLFSAWTGRQDIELDGGLGFVAKQAQVFCWGVKPAWSIMRQFYEFENHDVAMRTTKDRFEAYTKAKKFLIYGEMLREPALLSPRKNISVKWNRSYGPQYRTILLPEFFLSAWKAQDRSRAVTAYNITTEPRTMQVKLPVAEYGPVTEMKAVYPADLKFQFKKGENSTIAEVTLPPRVPVVLEWK